MNNRPASGADQSEMTSYLNEINKKQGLEGVMEELFRWSLDSGYISRGQLEENSLHQFYDLRTDISFSYQINYSRTKYAAGTSLPLPENASCIICRENGSSPGKEHLRVYDLKLNDGEDFFIQLTPYPLFPRHYVLISTEHKPMCLDDSFLKHALSFVRLAPSYTLCSNSDLPWAGASILSHSHFQLLHKMKLPVMQAVPLFRFESNGGFPVDCLNFPLPAVRLEGKISKEIIREGSLIIDLWKKTAPGRRTVNMVICAEREKLSCILLLRDSECRNPEVLQKYKSEGIGVVEAAGSWIFPPPEGYPEEELRSNSRDIIGGFFKGISPFDPRKPEHYNFLPYKRIL